MTPSKNNISYLNKSFSDFKNNLLNYTKTYFPNNYNDFSDANPGALFIDLAAYVGDVSSFYLDTQIQETFLLYAKERENLMALSYMLGYRPQVSHASNVVVDIFQIVPSIISEGVSTPNYDYALIIPTNTPLTSASTGISFLTVDKVDFNDVDNNTVSYLSENFFLLQRSVNTISAEIKSVVLPFSTPQKFQVASITDNNILQILDATDADDNKWYEVPYLAQSSILSYTENPSYESDGIPYLVNYQKVPRRFVSRFLSNDVLQLEFGSGVSNISDTTILPTPDNINLGLVPGISNLSNNYNVASTFFTREYGLAPSSDITVRYLVGGGIQSNVASNDINTIDKSTAYFPSGVSNDLANQVMMSLASSNPSPAVGGRGADEIEEIRNNALYAYQSQLRAVTKEDYIVRALSLPNNYGSVAKVYVTQEQAVEHLKQPTIISSHMESNPLSLDMYILGYNANKQIVTSSETLKKNLATYINQYRMVTDAINIKDAFYINIMVDFDIRVQRGYNNTDVVTNCILALKDFFNIDNWTINQPIVISDIMAVLLQVKGVQSVVDIKVLNKQDDTGLTYSKYAYDIAGATRNGHIYPSLDPSIFEVRYPDTDIYGRVVI
jgi:hypothetical protein